jgi:transposase
VGRARLTPEQSREKQALGVSRGGLSTKIHILCEGQGKPLALTLTPGQDAEGGQVQPLLDQVQIGGKRGAPRRRLGVVAGDKGYDSRQVREEIRSRGSRPLIAHRKDRAGQYPEAARGFDKKRYRRRNVVERLINRLKSFRRIATRFEKLADGFAAMILLGFIRIWIKDLLPYTP